jgi:hypothetical protein
LAVVFDTSVYPLSVLTELRSRGVGLIEVVNFRTIGSVNLVINLTEVLEVVGIVEVVRVEVVRVEVVRVKELVGVVDVVRVVNGSFIGCSFVDSCIRDNDEVVILI